MRISLLGSGVILPVLASTLWLGCSGGGSAGINTPPVSATLSGSVRDAASQSPIANATVTVGTASATSAANGRFELQNVPIGPAVTVQTSAGRFDSRTETITVNAGANTHDVFLTVQTMYEGRNFLAYLPPGVPAYRAAIVFLAGTTGDSRQIVRGDTNFVCSIWCDRARSAEFRRKSLLLAEGRVVLIGSPASDAAVTYYDELRAAMAGFGTASAHPELTHLPLLLVGGSLGGCTAYQVTRVHSADVIGFVSMKGGCHSPFDAALAVTVPASFFIGGNDEASRRTNITRVFDENRAAGALWSVAIEPNTAHDAIVDIDMLIRWMDAVLTRRLPESAVPGGPVTLRPITEASGWLGDRSSFAVAQYGSYSGDKLRASWLPSEQTARDWQALVSVPDAGGRQ
jgi:hypothetical protein